MKYKVVTLGCKVNTYESESMKEKFSEAGYSESLSEDADVVVINTCSVTSQSDSKSRNKIRNSISNNKDAIICVVGCYSQMAADEVARIEGVDIILGTSRRGDLVKLVEQVKKSKTQIIQVEKIMDKRIFEENEVTTYRSNTRAFIKIQDGCSNFCTFCIIPHARGLNRSRKKENIIHEIQRVVDNGFLEVVLAGIHTGGYGEDLENYSFDDLIVDIVNQTAGLKRLRISSIEMNQITDRLLEFMKTSGVIVDHLHIPLQSGSDKILGLMKRKYKSKQFIELVVKIKNIIPSIAITTDIIVGFPTETDEDFLETCNVARAVGFSALHVFPYSIRKNTVAGLMKEQVEPAIKKERVAKLMEISRELSLEYMTKFIDKELAILFEYIEEGTNLLVGYSSNYIKVKVLANKKFINQIKYVKIKSINSAELFAYGEEV